MRDHVTLATANANQDAQASLPISLPWLIVMAEKCSEPHRPPVSCRALQKQEISPSFPITFAVEYVP